MVLGMMDGVEKVAGERHHLLSKKITRALDKHETLKGKFNREDPRFIYKAANKKAHKGYQKWHIEYDETVREWLVRNKDATSEQFLKKLHDLHQESWIRERIPNVDLLKK